MASIRQIFEVESPYEEDREAFYEFMENNCESFFSHVGNTRYKVPYLLVKSVINEGRADGKGAKHRMVWKKMAKTLTDNQTSKNRYQNFHKAIIPKMLIDQSKGSYQRLMNLIQQYLKDFEKQDRKFNVVKYMYQDNFFKGGNFVNYK